jgi:hypothetical protein
MPGRPYEFPSPNDRSVNNPHTTVERDHILGLYNQSHPNDQAKNLSDTVRNWFRQEADSLGWKTVSFVDDIAILGAIVNLG